MISQELQFDASAAEQTIQQLDQQLQQTAELFKVALADALSILEQPLVVPVSADTTQATTEIDALATQPPVDVPVSADTTTAQDEIHALADQPPVEVPVDANVDAAKSSIDSLPAEVPQIDIPVEADTTNAQAQLSDLGSSAVSASSGVDSLEGSMTGLGAAIGVSEGSAKELVSTLGEMGGEAGGAAAAGVIGLGAATAGFFEEGLNAVSAGQRFDLVLGDMGTKIKEIDVNGLHTSMEDLGIQFGSTGAEMENANSKLFQFAINAGASKEKAVEFAQQVETLAARAISLNPQLGTLSDVTETLGPKLARGGRFASEFGLALTPAEIASRALSDTGKTLTADLTVQEKAMAGAEIASERYGSSLAGTVAEGAKNAAVEMASLKATFKEALEQIGVPLVAPVFDVIKKAEPDAALIAQDLALIATDALPVLGAALNVVAIPLQIVDAVLSEIPGPLITATAAFFGLQFALDAVAGAIYGDTVAMAGLNLVIPEIAIAAAAIVAVTGLLGSTPPYADAVTKAIDTAAKGFDDFATSVDDVVKSEVDAAVKTGDFGKRLNDAGVSADDLAKSVIDGGDSFRKYEVDILKAADANDASGSTIIKLSQELDHLRDSTENAALKALESAVATGQITDAERTEAEAKAGQIDGHVNWAAALDIVQPKIKAATDAADAQAKAEKDAADNAAELKTAMDGLSTSAPAVASALDDVLNKTGPTADGLLALGSSIADANLSTKEIAAIAGSLGVTEDELKGFAKDAAKALDDFVQTGLKGLPDLSSAIDNVLNPPEKPDKAIIIDPEKLQAEIDADINKINAFNLQIAYLHQHGLDNLAKISTEKGPEFTKALLDAIDKGGDDVGSKLEEKFAALNKATQDEGPALRVAGGPIITATGEIASIASQDFHGKFDITAPTQEQINLVNNLVTVAHVPYAEAWRQVGGDAAVAYQQAIGAIPPTTDSVLIGAGDSILLHKPGVVDAASGAGGEAAAQFGTGINPLADAAGVSVRGAIDSINNAAFGQNGLIDFAYSTGALVGAAFDDGISAGIDKYVYEIVTSAQHAVDAGVSAARVRAGVRSPSTVMAELGQQMATGLALGLSDTASVEAAGKALIATAVDRGSLVHEARSTGRAAAAASVVHGGDTYVIFDVIVPTGVRSTSEAQRFGEVAAGPISRRIRSVVQSA